MQRVVHQLELSVVELTKPLSQFATSIQVSLKGSLQRSRFPMDSPLLFEEERLLSTDTVRISLYQDSTELASAEFQLSDQFPSALEGDFDMWFRLAAADSSPSKQQRIRVAVSLREVASKKAKQSPRKRIELPEGVANCPRCEFLETLTASQQNELQSLAESNSVYSQVAAILDGLVASQQLPSTADVDSLALELPKVFRGQTGSLSAQDADHLRMVVLGLNEKLKAFQALQREVQTLRAQLQDSHAARKSLELSVAETTQQLRAQAEKQSDIHEHLISERQAAVEALRQQHLRWKEKCDAEEKLQAEVAQLRGSLAKQQAENGNYIQMKAHLESLKAELREAENQRQLLRQQYSKSTQDFEARAKESQAVQARLAAEKLQLQAELDRVQSALLTQRADTDRASQEVLQLKARIAQVDSQLAMANNQVRTVVETKSLADTLHSTVQSLEGKLQESAQAFQRQLEDISALNAKVRSSESKAQAELSQQEAETQARTAEVQNLTREKLQLTASIATLEQMLCVQEDLSQMTETVTTQNDMNAAMKDQLVKELGAMSQSLLQQSERGLSANRLVTKMRELMEDKEFEIDILRRMVTELQRQRPTYIPVKDDPVDLAIAEYCNARSKPLDVPFLREDQGIYVFGSKRVFIKMENGKIIIRVGGGFMQIDEFVDIYTPLELEKLETKKVEQVTRHQSLLGKMATHAVQESLRGKPDVSPQKAAKIIKDYFSAGNKFATMFAVPRRKTSPPKKSRSSYDPS